LGRLVPAVSRAFAGFRAARFLRCDRRARADCPPSRTHRLKPRAARPGGVHSVAVLFSHGPPGDPRRML